MQAMKSTIMSSASRAARTRLIAIGRPPGKSSHFQEQVMKFNPFIAVSSPYDDVEGRDAINALGIPGADIRGTGTAGYQFQNLRVLLSHKPFHLPEALYGTLNRRSEPSRIRPGAPIARHSGASVPIFFATFVEALQESRRCQAAREIARYQHLVEEARAYEVRRERIRGHSKGAAGEPSAAKRPGPNRDRSLLSIVWRWLWTWVRSAEPQPRRPQPHYKARKGGGHGFGTDAA
jgi:hypothetical protein